MQLVVAICGLDNVWIVAKCANDLCRAENEVPFSARRFQRLPWPLPISPNDFTGLLLPSPFGVVLHGFGVD